MPELVGDRHRDQLVPVGGRGDHPVEPVALARELVRVTGVDPASLEALGVLPRRW
jgi:hypothetical protein